MLLTQCVGRLNRYCQAFSTVYNNTLIWGNRESSFVTLRIAPIVICCLTSRISTRIKIDKSSTFNSGRQTFPNVKSLSTPTDAASSAIADLNLLNVGSVVANGVKRDGYKVVVRACGFPTIADIVSIVELLKKDGGGIVANVPRRGSKVQKIRLGWGPHETPVFQAVGG